METDHDQHPDLASRPVAPAAHRALATLAARADALAAHLDPPLSATGDVPAPSTRVPSCGVPPG